MRREPWRTLVLMTWLPGLQRPHAPKYLSGLEFHALMP
jgi:hypothetical protein